MPHDRPPQDDVSQNALVPRFDTAHVIPGTKASSPELPARASADLARAGLADAAMAAAGQSPVHGVAQLQQQASELAAHLRKQLRSVTQREATLNSQIAEWEREQRAGRLWLRERTIELNQREVELQRRTTQLEQTRANTESVEQTKQDPTERLVRQIPPPSVGTSREELRKLNSMLLRQLEQIQQQHESMAYEYELLRTRTQRQRRQLAERLRRERRQLNNQKETLRRRQRHWVSRKSTLEGLRDRLLQQQQSLEASQGLLQQVWAECCRQIGKDSAIEKLDRLRKTDSTHDPDNETVLAEYKHQLEQLADELQRQQRQLERRRTRLRQSATEKQQDFKRLDTELRQRQTALEQREIQLAEDRSQWFRQWSRQQAQIQQWLQTQPSKAA